MPRSFWKIGNYAVYAFPAQKAFHHDEVKRIAAQRRFSQTVNIKNGQAGLLDHMSA